MTTLRDIAITIGIVIVICVGVLLMPVLATIATGLGVLLCICALAAIIYSVLHDTVD